MTYRFLKTLIFSALLVSSTMMIPFHFVHADTNKHSFSVWLKGVAVEAKRKGISESTLTAALKDLSLAPRVLELDRHQPEFTQTFWAYLNKRITKKMVAEGKILRKKHHNLLTQIYRKFGVQPRFLLAFWGLETRYGQYLDLGSFLAIKAVATLAYDARRADFFRKEMFSLLGLMDKGLIPVDAKSSWAGAMGNFQFLPTTFENYAVSFNDSSQIDIWKNLGDSFASAANYLSKIGWNKRYTWGREVKLPENFDPSLANISIRKSLFQWKRIGVRHVDGQRPLPNVNIYGAILLPAGPKGPAFLVYENFRKIMMWNHSQFYALAVGFLADQIAGKGTFPIP